MIMANEKSYTANKPHCILSLDGGGTWALIQVKALLRLFGDAPGHEVLKNFDLVAATSAGSIVLAGLLENVRLSVLLESFLAKAWRQTIFKAIPWYDELTRVIGVYSRFSTEEKLTGLEEGVSNERRIPALIGIPAIVKKTVGRSPNFLITSFNYDRQRVSFFRSQTNSLAASFSPATNATLVEAVHASTNAPINFFDLPARIQGSDTGFWDGAVSGNNNPVLAAVTEALANQVPREIIRALSIGTGNVFLPLASSGNNPINAGSPLLKPNEEPGLIHDIKEIATSIIDDPPDAATFITHVTLGGRLPKASGDIVGNGPVVRMNPLVQPVLNGENQWLLPGQQQTPPNPNSLDMADFQRLLTLDIAAVEDDDVECIVRFCDKWLDDIVTNQPIRARSDTLAPEIGHGKFSLAQTAWLRCI